MKKWKLSWKLVVLSMLVTILFLGFFRVFGLVWGLVIVEKNVTTDDFDKTIRLWGEKDVRYLNVKLLGNKYTIDFSPVYNSIDYISKSVFDLTEKAKTLIKKNLF